MKRRALITGGAKRLGKAMALELAEQGIDIVIHFNSSSEEAEETRDLAKKKWCKCRIIKSRSPRNGQNHRIDKESKNIDRRPT